MNNKLSKTQQERFEFLDMIKNRNVAIIIMRDGYIIICPKLQKVKFQLEPIGDCVITWDEFLVWLRIETTPVSKILNLHLEGYSYFYKTV